jgi:hypothetical protein
LGSLKISTSLTRDTAADLETGHNRQFSLLVEFSSGLICKTAAGMLPAWKYSVADEANITS